MALDPPIEFGEFVEKIRAFKKSSFLGFLSTLLWEVYRTWSTPADQAKQMKKQLFRSYGGRFASIAGSVASELGYKDCSENELSKLIDNFMNIKDTIHDKDNFLKIETAPLIEKILKSKILSPYITDHEHLQRLAIPLFFSRNFRSQHELSSISGHTFARNYLIFKFLFQINPDHETSLKSLLNYSPVDVIRVGLGLLGLCQKEKGRLNLELVNIGKDASEGLGITIDSLRHFAEKWSSGREDYETWFNEVEIYPEFQKRYTPYLIYEKPLIKIDSSFENFKTLKSNNYYICHSPWHLIQKVENYLIESSHELKKIEKKSNILNDLGTAIENYFYESLTYILGKENVIRIPKGPNKSADFVLKTNNRDTVIILEVKKTFGHHKELCLGSPENFVDIFEVLFNACNQISNTQLNLNKYLDPETSTKTKKYVNVVCTMENIVAEGDVFINFAFNTGILNKLSLNNLEVFTIADFENILITDGPDAFVDLVLEAWEAMTPQKLENSGSFKGSYIKKQKPLKNYKDWAFLENSENEILPKNILKKN